MDKRVLTALVFSALLLAGNASAERILFYEVGTASGYTIETGYSQFTDDLRSRYEVASIEKGELTKDKLENYDVLVVQELNKQLSTSEISSIIWFVLQEGKGLLINGGGERANQLTIPFGVTVDSGTLIDTSDQIPALNDRNSFTVDRFEDHSTMRTLRQGVSKVGFYKGSGLILSGNTRCIVKGNSDTYSDTGSFAAGSQPCVAAASQFGGGLVFVLSDADMLSDKYLADYNNRNFGMNIVEWLSISTQNFSTENSTQELQLLIKELRLQNLRLEQEAQQLTDEKKELTARYTEASLQVSQLQQELLDIKGAMIGPFSRTDWAIILLGACILIAAIVYSKKKGGETKLKDDDILNELGYELEGGEEEGGEGEGLDELNI